mmetsp:Transcript_35098/g.70179  ORF Transcript_35098/g.70179 Transcript_35098/m.70179 type:complete len:465 (+) Transcript_35098:904-2298(+)
MHQHRQWRLVRLRLDEEAGGVGGGAAGEYLVPAELRYADRWYKLLIFDQRQDGEQDKLGVLDCLILRRVEETREEREARREHHRKPIHPVRRQLSVGWFWPLLRFSGLECQEVGARVVNGEVVKSQAARPHVAELAAVDGSVGAEEALQLLRVLRHHLFACEEGLDCEGLAVQGLEETLHRHVAQHVHRFKHALHIFRVAERVRGGRRGRDAGKPHCYAQNDRVQRQTVPESAGARHGLAQGARHVPLVQPLRHLRPPHVPLGGGCKDVEEFEGEGQAERALRIACEDVCGVGDDHSHELFAAGLAPECGEEVGEGELLLLLRPKHNAQHLESPAHFGRRVCAQTRPARTQQQAQRADGGGNGVLRGSEHEALQCWHVDRILERCLPALFRLVHGFDFLAVSGDRQLHELQNLVLRLSALRRISLQDFDEQGILHERRMKLIEQLVMAFRLSAHRLLLCSHSLI